MVSVVRVLRDTLVKIVVMVFITSSISRGLQHCLCTHYKLYTNVYHCALLNINLHVLPTSHSVSDSVGRLAAASQSMHGE